MLEQKNSLLDNLKILLAERGLTVAELARISKIPKTTLYGVFSGEFEPKLSTLRILAKIFNVNISQLLGESSLNCSEIKIPILTWDNLNSKTGDVEFIISKNTKYISVEHENNDPLYALLLNSDIYTKYKKGSIFIISYSKNFKSGDIVLISSEESDINFKKIIIESNITYLKSMSDELPITTYSKNIHYVFGIVKEIRTKNH